MTRTCHAISHGITCRLFHHHSRQNQLECMVQKIRSPSKPRRSSMPHTRWLEAIAIYIQIPHPSTLGVMYIPGTRHPRKLRGGERVGRHQHNVRVWEHPGFILGVHGILQRMKSRCLAYVLFLLIRLRKCMGHGQGGSILVGLYARVHPPFSFVYTRDKVHSHYACIV